MFLTAISELGERANPDAIAEKTGFDVARVRKTLGDLREAGYVVRSKDRLISKINSWNYTWTVSDNVNPPVHQETFHVEHTPQK
jgi:hypothetical protein